MACRSYGDRSGTEDGDPSARVHVRRDHVDRASSHAREAVSCCDTRFAGTWQERFAGGRVERAVLVGHSMGTPVVLRYARLYPEHVTALVFVDGLMPLPPDQAVARAGQGATMGGPNGRAAREAMIRRFFVAGTMPEVQAKVLNMMLGAPEATAVGAMNASREPAGQSTEIPKVPILGIYSGPSAIASEERVHSAFSWAEYESIPGTGHFLMLEKPREFERLLLAFLTQQKF